MSFTPSRPVLWKPEPIPDQSPVDTAAIRAWARDTGYDVPHRGRIPSGVREAWDRHNSCALPPVGLTDEQRAVLIPLWPKET
ncbi:histone-like nucleoid-structuring protein Lsr2 [Streptomyces sp. NRRL F-2747]|uniref:Lsr2 family DNA-binding protein n=1 Tax=Streptomyces sp. NPDC085665 TaxID=3365735 RepID=UPI00099DB617